MRTPLFVAAAMGIAGCIPPVSPSQLLAESAYDMNVATRFGRMDVALDYVGEGARDDFITTHAGWGQALRVVDVELTKLDIKEKDQAEVALSVIWQRQDEAFVRTTQIAQRWQDGRGGWRMTSEKRSGGDLGLIDERPSSSSSTTETTTESETPSAPRRTGFQTTIIRASE